MVKKKMEKKGWLCGVQGTRIQDNSLLLHFLCSRLPTLIPTLILRGCSAIFFSWIFLFLFLLFPFQSEGGPIFFIDSVI